MKIKLIPVFLTLVFILNNVVAQENIEKPENDSIYSFVDKMPEFQGGLPALSDYLSFELNYPELAVEDSIEGRVYVGFVVERDGKVSNVKLIKGIGGGCDEEAVRVIRKMPLWIPGKLNGTPVRVYKTLPISFSLAIPPPSKQKIYIEVDSVPQFPGGEFKLNNYLINSISEFQSKIDSTHNHLDVYFVVERDGRTSNVFLKDSINVKAEKEIKTFIQNMPLWKPGKIGNTDVRTLVMLPMDFSKLKVFTVIESMPKFPEEIENMFKFLAENMKYPETARNNGIQGRVFINFIVEPDGSITNAKVLKGIGGGCDEEALRVVNMMPKWKPGTQHGKPVRVSYNLPVKFTLDISKKRKR